MSSSQGHWAFNCREDRWIFNSRDDVRVGLERLREGEMHSRYKEFKFSLDLPPGSEAMVLVREFLREFSSGYPGRLLDLNFACRSSDTVSATELALAISEVATQVRSIALAVNLAGGIEPLLDVLRRMRSLESFQQNDPSLCRSSSDAVALAHCLATLPSLKSVEMQPFQYKDHEANDTLEVSDVAKLEIMTTIAQINGLEDLYIGAIASNTNLQALFDSFTARSSLKTLDIETTHLSASNAAHAVQLLRRNASVETLSLPQPDVSVSFFAQGLETNSKLRVLCFYRARVTVNDTGAFLHLLKHGQNYTLEELKFIGWWNKQLDPEIDFYLKLNKHYKRKLLFSPDENATPEDWIRTIISARKDPAVVFYYLSYNIALLAERNNTHR
jgi:hypothetical protein